MSTKSKARQNLWNNLDDLNNSQFNPDSGNKLWSDYLSPMAAGKTPGSNYPAWSPFGPSGNLYAYSFAEGNYIYLNGFHINHDIKAGSKMYPHIHWCTDGTSTEVVEWDIELVYAKGHSQEAFGAPTIVTVSDAASSTPWMHQISEVSDEDAILVPEVDSLVLMRILRTTAGNNLDTVFGLFVDLHVEIDRAGTFNKAPNFYV